MGGDFERRWSQVKEAVAVMRACWEDEESSHSVSTINFLQLNLSEACSKPSPPVYLPSIMFEGQWSARVFKRIVEWGEDGYLS